jgi:serine/threonine protein kinase
LADILSLCLHAALCRDLKPENILLDAEGRPLFNRSEMPSHVDIYQLVLCVFMCSSHLFPNGAHFHLFPNGAHFHLFPNGAHTAAGHIRLTDFGLAKESMGSGAVTHTFCGTPE